MELREFNTQNVIENVKKDSIAEEMGIETGDIILSINGNEIKDIIDYKFNISDDYIVVEILKQNEEIWELEIEKDYDEDIGIEFTNPLIDRAKSCRNKCIFCFIDQLPKGMRKTLYFKDDDSRLSFLQGNFITLTNMSDEEIDRIVKYRISPINISVHTTDPELRVKMLNNKNAGNIYDRLRKLNEANIDMNCQIVLCPGINDGERLDRTINDLFDFYPNISSVAIVPVGLTKFREGLFDLGTFDKESSREFLDYIEKKQKEFLKEVGSRFVFASDEFYILDGREIPEYDEYEGFPQIENGIGLMRRLKEEVTNELEKVELEYLIPKKYTIATGVLAYDFMKSLSKQVIDKISNLNIEVIEIKNKYFGESITVTGLITGTDLIEQLKDKNIGNGLLITKSMLRSGEDVFLDDITIKDVEDALNTKVYLSDNRGKNFVELFVNMER
ncbi:DUF512 domain-containing protein [Abyssisolibacter fermentans]|uniref:DUF512 domain-containing protein n=1 Tax=Abyssisolibacter fermentans TaxID=1766203 RepID=UPI00083403AD|nr:DUF512 domain-containing protein [Abyssisolibacter fermentans]